MPEDRIKIVGDMILYNHTNAAKILIENLSNTELGEFLMFILNANEVRNLHERILELNHEIDILKARLGFRD